MNSFSLEQWVACGLWALVFLAIIFFWIDQRKDLIKGFKGNNNSWEIEEVVPLIWFILTPVIIFCVLVLNLSMSSSAWAAYDVIGLISFGAKVYLNTNKKQ